MTADRPLPTSPMREGTRLSGPAPAGVQRTLIALALACLVFGVLGLRRGAMEQFMAAYLVTFLFYLSLSLGALFFVLLHNLTGARWSIVLRRLAESMASLLPLLLLLFLPMLGWLPQLYPWAGKVTDPVLLKKTAWLNPPLFAIRAIIYFGVWIALATALHRRSLRQDGGDGLALSESMRRISAPGMLLFAVTITFAAFDWIMSLDAHWYSTILGVYFFAGAAVAIYASLILLALALQAGGWLRGLVTVEHFHDLGKMLFAFVVFWAYIAFSQMMLIWMGNLPEETAWYAQRWHPPFWHGVSWLLLIGHFLLPFLLLLPRTVKRLPPLLALAAAWMLLMHAVDCVWLVFPTLPRLQPPRPTDLFLFIGIGFLYAAVLIGVLQRRPLVPLGDPRLGDSIAFENP